MKDDFSGSGSNPQRGPGSDYTIDSPAGRATAASWLRQHLSTIREGGSWMVPRTATIYTVFHSTKTLKRFGPGDPTTTQVLKDIGWKEEVGA